MNNRQHTGLEKKVIKDKAKEYAKQKYGTNNPTDIQMAEAEKILTAAACYLTHCEAEYAIGSADYKRELAKTKLGATLTAEQNLLKATGLFTYSTVDIINPDGFIVKGNKSDKSSDADARKQKTQGIIYTQQKQTAVADAAAFISKTAGQYSAASTTYATYLNSSPTAQSKTAAGIMYGQALLATEIGFGASMVEQAFRPNVGKGYTDGVVDMVAYPVSKLFPASSVVINEAQERFKNSNTATSWQNEINSLYKQYTNSSSK
ncbi:MAG: hypothetical protein AB7D29_07920 [Campylobacterales bacterium]